MMGARDTDQMRENLKVLDSGPLNEEKLEAMHRKERITC